MIDYTQVADTSNLPPMVAALVVGILGIAFGLQKVLKAWKEGSVENSVIGIMHTELARLSDQNTKLTTELSKFQLEVVKLNNQLNDLTVENNRLHREVMALTEEVNRLHKLLLNEEVSERVK